MHIRIDVSHMTGVILDKKAADAVFAVVRFCSTRYSNRFGAWNGQEVVHAAVSCSGHSWQSNAGREGRGAEG